MDLPTKHVLLNSSLVLPVFLTLHTVNGIINVYSCVLILSNLYLWESSTLLHVAVGHCLNIQNVFIHSTFDGPYGSFSVWGFCHRLVMWLWTSYYVSLGAHVHTLLLGIYLGINLGLRLCGCSALVGDAKQSSKMVIWTCPPVIALYPCQHLLLLLLNFSHSGECVMISHDDLFCISLSNNQVEHLFICLLTIWISDLQCAFSNPLPSFLFACLLFFLLISSNLKKILLMWAFCGYVSLISSLTLWAALLFS